MLIIPIHKIYAWHARHILYISATRPLVKASLSSNRRSRLSDSERTRQSITRCRSKVSTFRPRHNIIIHSTLLQVLFENHNFTHRNRNLSIRQYLSGKPDASLVNGFTHQQKNKTINCAARTLRNIDSGYTVAYATDVLSDPQSCSEA